MNAFRKFSVLVLVALVAVFALGVLNSSAEAGGCHSFGYGGGSYGSYASCYGGSCYWPTTYHVVKPISYPVTYYDCYGRPYVVWQTSYGTNPVW